jgi:hypothetical protein
VVIDREKSRGREENRVGRGRRGQQEVRVTAGWWNPRPGSIRKKFTKAIIIFTGRMMTWQWLRGKISGLAEVKLEIK